MFSYIKLGVFVVIAFKFLTPRSKKRKKKKKKESDCVKKKKQLKNFD